VLHVEVLISLTLACLRYLVGANYSPLYILIADLEVDIYWDRLDWDGSQKNNSC